MLQAVFNHLVLPVQLPSSSDSNIDEVEQIITERFLAASRTLRDLTPNDFAEQWEGVYRSLRICRDLNTRNRVNSEILVNELCNIRPKDILILHIVQQNSGLLIYRQGEDFIFEAFEASPLSKDVLASQNALEWEFPGYAVKIPSMELENSSFRVELAAFVEQASVESIKRFAAKSAKASSFAFEIRDTVDPALISQMLMTLLEAHGERAFPPILRKRIRDDVCWAEGAEKPWRRSSLYLILRVAIQRHLCMLCGGEVGQIQYKFLICVLLAHLLDDSGTTLSPESLAFLKAKLCRRIAKLENDKEKASQSVRKTYDHMFKTFNPIFERTIEKSSKHIDVIWTRFKEDNHKPISPLPRSADVRDHHLTLSSSGSYLNQVLTVPLEPTRTQHNDRYRLPSNYSASTASAKYLQSFAKLYFALSQSETQLESRCTVAPLLEVECQERCIELAGMLKRYRILAAGAYDSNPEQISIFFLTVMEMWISMDECAVIAFPLLKDFNPGFPADIMDRLQIPNFNDMLRLRHIQNYLRKRLEECGESRMTIFEDPKRGCFAERYFNESVDSAKLEALHQCIALDAEFLRDQKTQEWSRLSAEYEDLVQEWSRATCLFTTSNDVIPLQIHDERNCRKCSLERKSKRMRIGIFEYPLPSNPIFMKAVVFELACPEAFTLYRDATWGLLGTWALPKQVSSNDPLVLLTDYSALKSFRSSVARGLTLGSTTKSFLQTHYARVRFPTNLASVCLSNGLKYSYFDSITKRWPGRNTEIPTFAFHLALEIPSSSPFSALHALPSFAADSQGPSSYEVVASQPTCPNGLNLHEFVAYQNLYSSKNCRWPLILLELGSSNLNFCSEAVLLLISRLALQVGPAYDAEPRGAFHKIFRHVSFCNRLLEQIEGRLTTISCNYRESYGMDMLLTVILRIHSIADEPLVITAAAILLDKARTITHGWIGQLRTEINKATDANSAQRCSEYLFISALICRRTFTVHVTSGKDLQPSALRCFIECSITLQDNLVSDPTSLPRFQKAALIRDLKMINRMEGIVRRSLESNPEALSAAVLTLWGENEDYASRSFSKLMFLENSNQGWVELIIDATENAKQQTIDYNFLYGHLLVDGQPLGNLPVEHRESVIIRDLFGDQRLLAYPSSIPGMRYMLAHRVHDNEIHVGIRNGISVVRALTRTNVFEYVPHKIFIGSAGLDLPGSLIYDCVHWIDIKSGIMEIREKPSIWRSRGRNWSLNVNTRRAWRQDMVLVDPQSSLFLRVASILDRFEERSRLTVFQRTRGRLVVELKRPQLSFFVNGRSLLESPQLKSEIDPGQDAGTLYGLVTKLVLRDVTNSRQRSIMVPMGGIKYTRKGCHVTVHVEKTGSYGRYTINDTLGRLDSASEPRLLYMKALLHACTSFVLPDPLTGRTGTEEAIHVLKSGNCQPWAPLRQGPHDTLLEIAKLTPKRNYYPCDTEFMQKVFWDSNLTTTIQNEEFRLIIESLCKQSEELSIFELQKVELPPLEDAGNMHLLQRSLARRKLFQRPCSDSTASSPDMSYKTRDCCPVSQRRVNVLQSTKLIRRWPSRFATAKDLAFILQNWPAIEGYSGNFEKALLSDCLDTDFSSNWGPLVNRCLSMTSKDKHQLMFLMAMISFRNDIDMEIVLTLIAFAVFENLKSLKYPKWPTYIHFKRDKSPKVDWLLHLIKPFTCLYTDERDDPMPFHVTIRPNIRKKLVAEKRAHEKQVDADCKALADHLISQWPCLEPEVDSEFRDVLIAVDSALGVIRGEWQAMFHGYELSEHLRQVQDVLDQRSTLENFSVPTQSAQQQVFFPRRYRGKDKPVLISDLMKKACPKSAQTAENGSDGYLPNRITQLSGSPSKPQGSCHPQQEASELESIIEEISSSESTVRQQYGKALKESLRAMQMKIFEDATDKQHFTFEPAALRAKIVQARRATAEQHSQICKALEWREDRARWLKVGGLWPSSTCIDLLEQLRSTVEPVSGDGMKSCLVNYALSITALQRLLRIEDANLRKDSQKLQEECENSGHSNWQPLKYPDWLLLEICTNILLRPDQVEVAFATISPSSEKNSVLQMNMGQGKTSCIIPMAAAILANGKSLVRVVIPKSLLSQTAQLLHSRLGSLLGREIRHVPFSRKTITNEDTLRLFCAIHKTVLSSSGVIITLPEHILSFKLSGIQKMSNGQTAEATRMLEIQDWFSKISRDILDECDYTLAVRTQLIYPSGSQTIADGAPHRWETAQSLLRLVNGHLLGLQASFPQSIEVVHRPKGGFPFIFFLRQDAETALLALLVTDVCSGRTSILPTCSRSDRLVIKHFISQAKVQQSVSSRIQGLYHDKPAVKQTIYLLRGLLVHRILLLTLKKRWNVNYGIHHQRDPIAVPFTAKNSPSEQAEFGQIDVAILLTILAFYYEGLTKAQLRQSLEHVLRSDDPSSAYDRWTDNMPDLPDSLREWNAINCDDESQLVEIWRYFRYNMVAVDYFLNHFVFPKHARQFQLRLQASGWDIPLFSPTKQLDSAQTTGFSGTNDGKTMLPLTIKQQDLPGLAHTSASVLTYLLQPRSRAYVLAADDCGRRISELDFLLKLKDRGIRVLIDAGAMILEMDNLNLAKAWLNTCEDAPAAIYFDERGSAWCLYRQGSKVPLLASPFADNSADCLVYIDEAHTRGIDLKMPPNARGALTLGIGQTKDQTVQAAMRLRQLGVSQSVVFFAPPEVHQSIVDLSSKEATKPLDSTDVIRWLLVQTCDGIEQLQPLYYSQGVDFCRRMQASQDNPQHASNLGQREKYLKLIRQIERQTLEQLYGITVQAKSNNVSQSQSNEITEFMKELKARRRNFQDNGNACHSSALQEVEQEREVAFEIETVREVQQPVRYLSLSFPGLHKDILRFVKTGRLAADSGGYEQLFTGLARTNLGQRHRISNEAMKSKLFASTEFVRTIQMQNSRSSDNFHRQVNWILWSCSTETALIINVEEAELLLPVVCKIEEPLTYLLTYAAPITRKMLQLSELKYYTMPSLPTGWSAPVWLKVELGVFSGRLYFEYAEYSQLCKFLGVDETCSSMPEDGVSGMELPEAEELDSPTTMPLKMSANPQSHAFTSKPLSFIHDLLALRRKGQDFEHTPMGYFCHGKPLIPSHPFFVKSEDSGTLRVGASNIKLNGKGAGKEMDEFDDISGDDDYDDPLYHHGESDQDNEDHEE